MSFKLLIRSSDGAILDAFEPRVLVAPAHEDVDPAKCRPAQYADLGRQAPAGCEIVEVDDAALAEQVWPNGHFTRCVYQAGAILPNADYHNDGLNEQIVAIETANQFTHRSLREIALAF